MSDANDLRADVALPAGSGAVPGTLGRRAFLAGTAGAVVGAAALSSTVSAVEPGASYFQSLPPTRLCDTRDQRVGIGFQRLGPQVIRVKIAGSFGVPADAVAAVLTVTAVNRTNGGIFVTAYPSDVVRPEASNLNCGYYDERVANLVTVQLGQGGAGTRGYIDIYSHGPAEIVVDVAGAYRSTSVALAAGRLVTLAATVRALDTRVTGGKVRPGGVVTCNLNGLVPSDAAAVVANLTAVEPNAQGFLTAYPHGRARPDTSNLNPAGGQNRAVGIITQLGTAGGVRGIDVYTLQGAHVLVDVVGYITGPGSKPGTDGLFVPMAPRRLLDTRTTKTRLWPGWTRTVAMPVPINTRAQAVAVNLTATQTMNRGYFTLLPAQTPRREVSTLNVMGPGQTIANHAVAAISTKGLSVYSHQGAHVIVDINGWYTGGPTAPTVAPPYNRDPPGGPLPYVLDVPKMGLTNWVFDGASDPIVDHGNSWHWAGTGLVGEGGHVVVFGHRTEHGGPYRYQHLLRAGDPLYVYTADHRLYTYRLAAEYITSKYSADILAATRRFGGETFSLVSCSRTDRLPTDLQHRLVSTFQLIEWVDLG